MSGLYSHNFSPARALSPHIRTTTEADSGQYLTELLEEHQKLGPFMQVLPICSRLLNQEILRISGMNPSQGFSDLDLLQRGSLSPMASPEIMLNKRGTGFSGWNGLPHDQVLHRYRKRNMPKPHVPGSNKYSSLPIAYFVPNFAPTIKCQVLLGDMGTGKTSLVLRFIKGQFSDYQESTIGAAFFTQVLSLNEGTIKFDIWDTAGQERYHSLAPMYYRGAAAAIVVYDITSTDSFERAKKWVLELQRQGNQNLIKFLAANKADLEAKRKVGTEEGELYAKENGLVFLETSAKTAQNVNELFYDIARKLVKAAPNKRPAGMKLHTRNQDSGTRMFCCSS